MATGGKKGKKSKKNATVETAPPEPVLAEPTGPCTESDIVATPALTSAAGGADVPITINLRTVVTEACTWQASPETMTVTITSGSDYIWSSRECPVSIPPQDVVVRQAVDTPVVVTWSARRSDEGCTKWTDWAMPGFYHVEAAALGGDGTDIQFELTGGVPAVVTTTADPQPQGGKNKSKNKNGDTSHTPGEDGAGNSAGLIGASALRSSRRLRAMLRGVSVVRPGWGDPSHTCGGCGPRRHVVVPRGVSGG